MTEMTQIVHFSRSPHHRPLRQRHPRRDQPPRRLGILVQRYAAIVALVLLLAAMVISSLNRYPVLPLTP